MFCVFTCSQAGVSAVVLFPHVVMSGRRVETLNSLHTSHHLITHWFSKRKKKRQKETLEINPADLLRRQIWTLGNTMTCMCGGYIWEVKHSVSIQLAIGKQRALFMPVYPVYACCFLCKPLWNLPLSQLLFSCCVHLISVMSTVTDAC